jgi:hypothetical protein
MAFEYSESAYGLRTYGSSVGEVLNASATVTATSSIANVNWVVAIGAAASLTATASITCSGEVIILEETDVFSYGSGLYGANEYTQGDLQTVVTATSTVTASCERILISGALSAGASSIAAIGGFTANVSATSTTTSATTSSGQVVGERSATVTVTSTVTSNATATYNYSIAIAAVASIACSAEKFFLESSDKFVYGSGLYGRQVYDAADLQTIVSATSVDTTCTAAKVNLASATVSAVASNTCDSEKIHQEGGSTTATSTITSSGNVIYIGQGVVTATSEFTQTTENWRVRESTGIVSSTSGTATIAREKWEIIAPTVITWDKIAA